MSTLGGLYNFNNSLVQEPFLTALSNALADRGPDGGHKIVSGCIGMAYRAFHTNKESYQEFQPLISAEGYLLTWDGRLDNRAELLAQLFDELRSDRTDAALVMASYLKWSSDFLLRLIGDFALALWDPFTRTLLLARDAFGTRPLYYYIDAKRIVWSSELRPLIDLTGSALEVDDKYVAGYLTSSNELWRTPYNGIRCVQPGHVVVVRPGRIEEQRFWSPHPQCKIKYKSDKEYEEHFLLLFREAVRCRLRATGSVFAELSGGLDSSSIVCMADKIIREGDVEPTKLETVSYVYDNSPTSDERTFIEAVEAQRRKRGHHFQEDDYLTSFDTPDYSLIVRPNPTYRFTQRHRWVFSEMQKQDARILLSGLCGDNLLWSDSENSPELSDLLVQFRLRHLHNAITSWCQIDRRSYSSLLWKGAVLPLMPNAVKSCFGREPKGLALVNPKFASKAGLNERQSGRPDTFGYSLPTGRAQSSILAAGIAAVSNCYYRDRVPTEYSFPYLHRPLVEFLFAIPFEQKLRPGETRSLQRRAMRNLLPEKIALRKGKRSPNEALCRATAANWRAIDTLFTDARVCARGYVDPQALLGARLKLRHGLQSFTAELTNVLSLELWLRALEGWRQAPETCN